MAAARRRRPQARVAIWDGSSEEPPGFPEASPLVPEASGAESLGALQCDPRRPQSPVRGRGSLQPCQDQ